MKSLGKVLDSMLDSEEVWALRDALLYYKSELKMSMENITEYAKEHPEQMDAAQQIIKNTQEKLQVVEGLIKKLDS